MSRKNLAIIFVTGLFLMPNADANAQHSDKFPKPPQAQKVPHNIETHGHVRVDEYYWLNDREDKNVISYLNQENDYTKSLMADSSALEKKLFDEIVGRVKQDDESVPYEDRGYVYYRKFNTGEQYPIFCRKLADDNAADGKQAETTAPEEIILNVNDLAKDKPYCNVASAEISENNKLLAYTVDYVGRRQYTIFVKNLKTGEQFSDEIPGVNGRIEWCSDNKTIVYTKNDPQTLRSYIAMRHVLGTPAEQDKVIFEEKDEEFNLFIFKSRSRDFIFIESEQTLSSEVLMLRSDQPDGSPVVFHPREADHEYAIDHVDGEFVIRSNSDGAENFRLLKASETDFTRSSWQEIVPHRNDVFVIDFDLFDNHLVVTERANALSRLRVIGKRDEADYYLPFDESCYVVDASVTPDPSTAWLRFRYTSLTTPQSTFQFNMNTKEKRLLKETPVLGDFDRNNYKTERVWATARDGAQVPVSVVYHKDTPIDGTAPCLEYAYGSYGSSIDPAFRSTILSLLDRGFVYAIAHIRGGQEMGRQWYDNGKLLKKINTFTDFIDVGKFLVEKKYSASERLYARGGSAGGLLMGAVMNMAPEQYHGVIADVPFVDVVTTMLDDSIPLTTFEYDEWGNPNEKKYYDYMLSYSPYDQVAELKYPNTLVTTGLHDSQVQYWEPAKWVARLRDHWQGNNLLLLKTNMKAGHGGASGRFDRYKEVAFRYAFLLKLQRITE